MFWEAEQFEKHKKGYTKLTSTQFNTLYNFEDGERLGKGTYGVVVKVKSNKGQQLAIKEFNSQAVRTFKQIVRQVDNLKYLTHPNIVRIYDCYIVDESDYYIVMEYCPKGSLFDYLQKNKDLTYYEKMMLCRNIASGLAYAHHKYIVHRDLKPENILIGRKNEAKICDFGCSTLTTNSQGKQIVMQSYIGSPAYMDKRITYCEPYDISVDIYSLGMVFYCIFKGKGIFDDFKSNHQLEEYRNEINANYDEQMEKILDGIPNLMKDIIKNCLQPDYTKRYTALQISTIFEKEIMISSRMSHIKSTVDDEEIQDQSSIFAIGLINYYKNINKTQHSLATREKVFHILYKYKQIIERIQVMQDIQYLQANTRVQFTTLVIFYYYYWLDRFSRMLNNQKTSFMYRYGDLKPESQDFNFEDEVSERIKKHISAQWEKYYSFFIKCCKKQKNKLNLLDQKLFIPSSFKKMINVATYSNLKESKFQDFNDEQMRLDIAEFIEKRIKKDFKRNCVKSDDQQIKKKLAILQSIASQL